MAVAKASYESIVANKLSREDLAGFRPPEYKYPYVVGRNPIYSREENRDWFRSWLLETEVDKVLSPKIFERFLEADLPLFNCFSHPVTALGPWGFQWATKFLGYLVIMDDVLDGPHMGQDPKTVLSVFWDANLVMLWYFPDDPRLLEGIKTFVRMGTSGQEDKYEEKMSEVEDLLTESRSNPGKAYPREVLTIAKSFLELWTDAWKRSAPCSMLLIAHATQHWMLGLFQEAETRKMEMSSNELEYYIEMRKKSGALFPLLTSREIASGFRTPVHWFYSPSMQSALLAASDLVSWDNDILSFAKELVVDKDVTSNVLVAISKCKSVNFEKAVEILHKMMDERVVDLEAAFADLEKSTPPELMPNFHIYVEAIHDLLMGTHYWCSVSHRYSY